MKSLPCGKIVPMLVIATMLAGMTACSILKGGGTPAEPTLSELAVSVAQTATAAKQSGAEVDDLATAQAKATQKSQEVAATQTARAGSQTEQQIAEATLSAPIIAELPQYGLDPKKGHTGWLQGPLALEISGYQQVTYGNDHMEVTAADFALAADITWNTQYGSSGCGFMFRSNGDKNKPDQYMILATRFGSGHVIFSALSQGEIANIHDFYARSVDKSFAWENGSTNRLAVTARGNLIEIYTNGVKIGEVDTSQPPSRLPSPGKPTAPLDQTNQALVQQYQNQLKEYEDIIKQSEVSYQTAVKNYTTRQAIFTDGFLAMIAASESGKTECTFNKAWLWLIEP